MVESCMTCAYGGRPTYDYPCNECVGVVCNDGVTRRLYHTKEQPMTNADHIRAMSDEELARLFVHYNGELDAYVGDFDHCEMRFKDALKAEVEWLQQPWEGDE